MSNIRMNNIVILELYNFISEYYNDVTLADYILDTFGIEKEKLMILDISFLFGIECVAD